MRKWIVAAAAVALSLAGLGYSSWTGGTSVEAIGCQRGDVQEYVDEEAKTRLAAALAARRPGVDPAALIPSGFDGLQRAVEAFVACGVSKFVVVPAGEPEDWDAELDGLATQLLPLQT